ncbi:MAG TPA: GNAT family N-acetyltransferase [Lactobacillaceae bacterium]|jgi:ribosomal protein S18 acetylase RimI-like enzyme
MAITYKINAELAVDDIIRVYQSSGINRPIEDKQRIAAMYAHANLVVSAWDDETLIGVARSLSDDVYVSYLADLAVAAGYQGQHIGQSLIDGTKQFLGDDVTVVLIAAPTAVGFYEKIGLERTDRAFLINRL